jgi:hypothetical protein
MNMLRFTSIWIISLLLPAYTIGQSMDFEVRKVIVITPDSTVKACVWNKSLKQKVNPGYTYYWYYANAINHNMGSNTGKVLHGKYEVFDSQQKLRVQGNFEYGVMTGNWYRWYPNGNIQFADQYKNGFLHGEIKSFANNGKPISIMEYKNGLLDGKSYFFLNDSTLTKEYKNGKELIKTKRIEKPKIKKEKVKKVEQPLTPKDSVNTAEKPKDKWWKFSFLKKKRVGPKNLK